MVKANMECSFPTNRGEGTYSYAKNSHYQRLSVDVIKEKINEVIFEKFDTKTIISSESSKKFCIADLGCATGPNTFISMQNILHTIKSKYQAQFPDSSTPPEFLLFFNDLPTNDFNTLITSLPKQINYFPAAVPGSFHGRLFPISSVHFVHAACAVHWLSKLPEELVDRNSPTWNKGRVHYTNAPVGVGKAYTAQFAEDMERFLSARAVEIVSGGMIVIIMAGVPHGMPFSQLPAGLMYDCMGSTLMEMATQGLVSEAQVDGFNLPMYAASPEEMSDLVERNGEFRIEKMELTNPASWLKGPVNIREWVVHMRAVMEELFTTHFGSEVVDEFFERLVKNLSAISHQIESSYRDGIQLLLVLKRK